nr:hypothetical protein [Tanacetum cinerariifolium]
CNRPGSGFSFLLAVATFFTSSGNFFWQWELYTWKSSVENLVPNLNESEGEYKCDVPTCEDFTTFSNILFDFDYDFSSSDDQSFYDEDILKEIYSNPLFDEEIISMKIDSHHFNAESDLI